MYATLIFEAAFVGITLAVFLSLAASIWPWTLSSFTTIAWLGFFLGAGLHLGFEFIGLNARYCSTGHACRS